MKISARNQLKGKVENINKGAVNATVKVGIADGLVVTSTISLEAVEDLGLTVGKEATAIIKATDVIVSVEKGNLSARNKLTGKIVEIVEGAVNSIVKIEVAAGTVVTSTISNESVKELGLATGDTATAIVKATSVLIMA